MHRTAKQSRLELLVRTKPRDITHGVAAAWSVGAVASRAWSRPRHQAAVIPPIEAEPRASLPGLVLHVSRGVELFIVVNSKWPRGRRHRAGSSNLRGKKSSGNAREHYQRGKSVDCRYAHAAGIARNLRAIPLNRECDWSRAQHAEVVRIVGVFPYVFARKYKAPAEGLLYPGMKLVAPSRTKRRNSRRRAKQQWIQDRVAASQAGEHQVFVE